MKFFIGLFMLAAVSSCSAETFAVAKRSVTCQTVLADKVCEGLHRIAANLKLLPSQVEEGIKQAVATGEKRGPEIYKQVIEFMKTQVLNKDCEYFLAPQQCVRLREAIKPLNLAVTVGGLVVEAIVKGAPGKAEIALRVLNLVRREVVGKSCDELLAVQMCNKLKKIAIKLALNAIDTGRYVVEAIIEGFRRADEVYLAVLDFYRQDVASLTCQDILSHQVCSALQGLGKIFKISPAEISNEVKEVILRGKLAVKEIVTEVEHFIKKIGSQKSCQELLPTKFCDAAEKMANDMKVKSRLVAEAVENALSKGKVDFNGFVTSCKEFFEQRVTCESWLGDKLCKTMRNFAKMFGVKTREVDAQIKALVSKGMTSVSEMFKKVVDYIRG